MADAQYVIDVAAGMSGGAQTVAQLDALSSTLMAAGVSADSLQDAVALATNALAAAKTSSADANAALAAGAQEFKALEQAALQAGKAQEKAAKLGVVPPETAAALESANAALAEQTDKLRGLESAASGAARQEAQLATTLANTKIAAAQGSKAIAEHAAAEAKAADVASKAVAAQKADAAKHAAEVERAENAQAAATKKSIREAEGFSPLAKQLGDFSDAASTSEGRMVLLSGAAVGAAAAIVAVSVAVAAGTIAIAAWAVGLADANRDAGIAREAMEAMHPELVALGGVIDDVADRTGLHADELQEWAGKLKAAKVSAEAMPDALNAVALAQAALGKGGADEFVQQIKAGKRSVQDLTKEVDTKLGPLVEARMKGLGAQSARFEKQIASLFGGLDIEPVLDGLETLVALFDENTAAGEAMKFLFESVFQPLIDQAQNAAYVIEAFALGFLIGLTKVYIAIKPAINAVTEFFGFDDTSLSDVLDIAKSAGEAAAFVFVGFVAVVGALGVAFAVAVAAAIAVQVAIWAVIAAVVAAAAAVGVAFYQAWVAVWDFLSSLPAKLVEVGANLMHGLAEGITGAAGAVIGAITGAVGGAVDSAKKLLGIASPSTVFADIGGYTGEGFVQGVDAMAGEAQAAMAGMVEPPDTSAPAITGNFSASNSASSGASAQPGGRSQGAGSLLGSNNTFIFQGVADAAQAEQRFEEMLTRVLEGDAGALVPEGAPA